MKLIAFIGVFLHLYTFTFACNTPCSGSYQVLEPGSCICKCLDQYEPSFDGKSCLPKCNVACLDNSYLNKTTCDCICIEGFYKQGEICVPIQTTTASQSFSYCNKICSPFEDFYPSTCECRCKPSCEKYDGECIPICNIVNCPVNSYVEKRTCQCLCNSGYYKDSYGNCVPQTSPTAPQTTTKPCSKSCSGLYEVINYQKCTCECGVGYERYEGACVRECNIPCPANSYLNKRECACVCQDGYYKQNNECVKVTTPAQTTTPFQCNKKCGINEILDTVLCICKPRCTKLCLLNSYLDEASCTCLCKPGYYKNAQGMCMKITTTQQTTTISFCSKSCTGSNEVLNTATCTCDCAKNFERYENECVALCLIPCPPNSYLNKRECACVCNSGYYKQNGFCVTSTTPAVTSTPKVCSRQCNANEFLDQVNCECNCVPFYERVDGVCVKKCDKVCLLNSVIDRQSCSCICMPGYYKDASGACVPNTTPQTTNAACTKTCGFNEVLDVYNCKCNCRPDCERNSSGVCIEICNRPCLENSYLDKATCSCICKSGFYKQGEVCVPIETTTTGTTVSYCNKSCDEQYEYLDHTSCECKKKY